MFYMGGMTLGYFSPHPVEVCESGPAGQPSGKVPAKRHDSLLDFFKPAVEQAASSRQPAAWPLHVFY